MAVCKVIHQIHDRPVIYYESHVKDIIATSYAIDLYNPPAAPGSDPAIRATVISHALFVQHQLLEAAKAGISQYVVVGAGLDTAAFDVLERYPGLTIYEVDNQEIQDWKISLFAAAGIETPANLKLVSADIDCECLLTALVDRGFDKSRPAFYSLLGAALLSKSQVLRLLEIIGNGAIGTEVVLSYVTETESEPGKRHLYRESQGKLPNRKARARCFFNSANLQADMGWMGYSKMTDIGCKELNTQYFDNRNDGLRIPQSRIRLLDAVV